LKNSSQEIRQNKIAAGCSINDFLGSPRHFPSPNFRCFEGKASFSTPTGNFTHDPVNECSGDVTTAVQLHCCWAEIWACHIENTLMTIEKAIKSIDSVSDAWVRVEQTRKMPNGVELCFGIYRGKRGAKIDSWSVSCLGVREAGITAFDGGGLRVYPGTHPAALRYTARKAELRWSGIRDRAAVLGALYRAHIDAVDDWIPFDEVVSIKTISESRFSCRGPDFLMRVYAKTFRAKGDRVRLILRRGSKAKSVRLKVLHFGDSYIVAAAFTAQHKR
jgi:hypothetical protein